jgi:ABC-type branched-subunit amino acid transport system substrate-binding protein
LRRNLLLTLLCATALVAAACGSNDNGPSSGGTASTKPLPKGELITLSAMAPVDGVAAQPEILSGAEAAVAAVNNAGGIADPAGGPKRPLKLIECKIKASDDPEAGPLKCAKDATSAGAIASVSKYSFSESATKAYATAGVPMVGTIGVSTEDYVNPGVFPISAGAAASGGAGSALQHAGAKTIAFISADNPAARYVPNFVKPVLEHESDLINETYIPLDASVDITPFIARVIRAKPDGVLIAESTDGIIKVVIGLRQAGYRGKIAVAALGPDAIEKMGSAADGLIVVSSFEAPTSTGNKTIKQFDEEMKSFDDSAAKDEFSLNAWLTVHLVADQLAKLPKIDAASLLNALKKHPKVDLGAAPPFQLGVGGTYMNLPNVPRATVQYQKVEGGEIVKDNDFVDLDDLAHK